MSIKVVAENWVKQDAVDQFVAVVEELVAETRAKDEGCLAYGLFRDLADPLHLTVLEEWESQALLDKHAASEHFQRLFPGFEAAAQPGRPGLVTVYEAVIA